MIGCHLNIEGATAGAVLDELHGMACILMATCRTSGPLLVIGMRSSRLWVVTLPCSLTANCFTSGPLLVIGMWSSCSWVVTLPLQWLATVSSQGLSLLDSQCPWLLDLSLVGCFISLLVLWLLGVNREGVAHAGVRPYFMLWLATILSQAGFRIYFPVPLFIGGQEIG